MSTYAIGDVQGCYDPLRRLLDKLQFDPAQDQLWFTGDLINRGPQSLETLRFVISLAENAKTILGNHECHFLAVARGHKTAHRADTFQPLIDAPDASALIDWLQQQPFLYEDSTLGYSMIHAGLPPQWSMTDARQCAVELEAVFKSDAIDAFLAVMYGDQPACWDSSLKGNERLRFIINCFTRLRYCDEQGQLNLKEKGAIGSQAEGLIPWFDAPKRKTANEKLLFGHWSTLGLQQKNNAICLDSGCLWGGQLSAIKLDGIEQIISQQCERALKPF